LIGNVSDSANDVDSIEVCRSTLNDIVDDDLLAHRVTMTTSTPPPIAAARKRLWQVEHVWALPLPAFLSYDIEATAIGGPILSHDNDNDIDNRRTPQHRESTWVLWADQTSNRINEQIGLLNLDNGRWYTYPSIPYWSTTSVELVMEG
jgi:hypothetical protein